MENQMLSKLTNNNLVHRIVTSLILGPIVILAICKGGLAFQMLILVTTILMSFEWNGLTTSASSRKNWQIGGMIYILLPTLSLIWLREQPNGKELILLLFSVVWAMDIGAFFIGKLIGGWKIWPSISPKKTWSGLIGGACCAALVGYIYGQLFEVKFPKLLIGLCVSLGIYAQVGDFIESWIKRKFNTKDSGKLLPGHGGVLDRVDGIVTTAVKLAIIVRFDKWGIFN